MNLLSVPDVDNLNLKATAVIPHALERFEQRVSKRRRRKLGDPTQYLLRLAEEGTRVGPITVKNSSVLKKMAVEYMRADQNTVVVCHAPMLEGGGVGKVTVVTAYESEAGGRSKARYE